MTSKFDHAHTAPLSLTVEALKSIDGIYQDIRRVTAERLAKEMQVEPARAGAIMNETIEPQSPAEQSFQRQITYLARPDYRVSFENNYQYSTSKIDDLLAEFQNEPSRATGLRMDCGHSGYVEATLNIQDRLYGTATVSAKGERAVADHSFRRIQRILESSKPPMPWLHARWFRVIVYIVVNIIAFLGMIDVARRLAPPEWPLSLDAAFVGIIGAVPATGLSWLAIETMKKEFSPVEFTIGWSGRHNGKNRATLGFILVALLLPIVLHWVGLT